MSKITCGYCGETFAEDQGQPTCSACPVKGACRFVRCPRCGYENPSEPEWLTRIRRWLGTEEARRAGYGASAPERPDAREESRVR